MDRKPRLALITGATSGIGQCLAEMLARRGVDLVLASRNLDRMEEQKAEYFNRFAVQVTAVQCDLAKPGSAADLAAQCRGMDIDLLINNSGFGRIAEHLDVDLEEVTEMAQLNMVSLVELCRLLGEPMRARRFGYIMNVASVAAFQPVPYFGEYAATKAFVLSFSESLYEELKPYGVMVSCLCPGPTRTNFQTGAKKLEPAAASRAMSALDVAQAGLEGLYRGEAVVVPGRGNQWITRLVRFVPRRLLTRTVAARFRRRLR